jgi:hypothetical protein
LIIGQIWAVVGRPIEFATQGPTGTSPAASAFYRPIRTYSEFSHLSHGYAFFAPDPGPSHLIRVNFESSDPDQPTEIMFPDRKQQWPRLLYHRHFMLTEFLHQSFSPREIPPPLAEDPAFRQRWQLDRARFVAILGSMENHLEKKTGAEEVRITRLEHQLIGLPEFLAGQRRLDDPSLYIELTEPFGESPLNDNPIPRFGFPGLGQ